MPTPGRPGSGYNASVEAFRDTEYPMLNGSVYLDHAGTTLYPKSLVDTFAAEMTSSLLGNPHSASASSHRSTSRIDDIRLKALQFFHADPAEFDLVFVANATAGIKLVAEAFRATPGGFDYAYHQASHTSLVGVREEARNSLCLDDAQVASWLSGSSQTEADEEHHTTTLFAYPAQSNMDGRRYPLAWARRLREARPPGTGACFTLLDAASLASTSPLDLSDCHAAPDFTVLSFYKIFGFPDLGALIVRRQAEPIFSRRRYFGGGTVDMVVCLKEQWHAPKSQALHERLEDGTLPVHSIIALGAALDTHHRLFGTMESVAAHTGFLSRRLHAGLSSLRHANGTPVCRVYSPEPSLPDKALVSGPVMAFNIVNHAGAWASLAEFEKLALLKQFHIRTGGVCNPGGIASVLGLRPWEMKRNFSSGFRCGTENDIIDGKPTGVIRVSLGAMSTISDVDSFIAFVDEFYRETELQGEQPEPSAQAPSDAYELCVKSITVYPIKSCGGFTVPENTSWAVRPEGLAWDREWCLIHRGSGQALSQKTYPKMALLRPWLDFERGQLRVTYTGHAPDRMPREVTIPLSNNPALFRSPIPQRSLSSRVCGEEISAQTYISEDVNRFFTGALGVPCVLARFPPGGEGKSMRHSKAHLQKHQTKAKPNLPAGAFPAPPSPPDSDAESERRRILLSNESPILAINLSSLDALNREIAKNGGSAVDAAVFRANIVLGLSKGPSSALAYSEDVWSRLRIGQHEFKMLGACRRCHMVCINQETAAKSQEPFVTLSKTRRFDGKVFFGTHMGHIPRPLATRSREAQHPTIRVGDAVFAEV